MRLVIKIGTSTLAHPSGKLNIRRVEELCKTISDLKNAGHEIVLVSSGAIGMGVGKLNLSSRPEDMPTKQAAAAVGQCELMYIYDKLFSGYNHTVAQILITGDDVEDDCRRTHFINTMERLLQLSVLPVINENDTVATSEISVGDNDTLAAIVSSSIGAQLLVLLTDTDGLYSEDPKKNSSAELLEVVDLIDDNVRALAGGAGSSLGTGGMATKIRAAEICCSCGVDTIIANGSHPEILYDIMEGRGRFTLFRGKVK